jgi:outer membrane protein assembly factor BamB
MTRLLSLVALIAGCLLGPSTFGADWPQFRHDATRSAASAESLPASMHLTWARELPAPRPASPAEVRLDYDATYEPVVLGKTMFVPSMVTDSVTALDTETGAERWRFFAEGPVRLAPVAWENKVCFVSDDGHLYCVGADNGKLLWKFRGLMDDTMHRNVMGNCRLVSLFPARGGPVLADGVIYFGAGIWSGEGVFVHAVNAATGKAVWSNAEGGRIKGANMDHGIEYFGGISPQGHLAIVDNRLALPNGNHLPALLDIETGKIGKYTVGWGGRTGLPKGCSLVVGSGKYLLHGGDVYDVRTPNQEKFRDPRGRKDFKNLLHPGGFTRLQIERTNQKALGEYQEPVVSQDVMYCQQDGVVALNLAQIKVEERAKLEIPEYRKNDKYPDKMKGTFPELWKLSSKSRVHIKAGNRLYCGAAGLVEAVDIPAGDEEAKISWRAKIQGTPHRMLAADGKLFVVTREGSILAFGQRKPAEVVVHTVPSSPAPASDQWTKKAARILDATDTDNGYVVMLGIGNGRLAEELVQQSKCDVIAVEPDAAKVDALREKFLQTGLYGTRIAIHVGDPMTYSLPPYVGSLIISEGPAAVGVDALDEACVKRLFRSLRPYGGTVCMEVPADKLEALSGIVDDCELPCAVKQEDGELAMLVRSGPLPEASNWSHDGANAANTGASQDRFVKAPLTRLWFDGSFRWHRKPGATLVRVAGGRMFVKSARINAIDVYTGRHLWDAPLPPSHGSASAIVALDDAIYMTSGPSCVVLDPATGEQTAKFGLPDDMKGNLAEIRIEGDYLVGTCAKNLICMNRHDGRLLWKHQRDKRVGSLALGGGRVFVADFVDRRRNAPKPDMSTITAQAFDMATGERLWQITGVANVRYSESENLVVTTNGAYKAADGTSVWKTGGVWSITGDKVLTGNATKFAAYDLATGKETVQKLSWVTRGCTILRAGENLLTTRFRGNAAYVDLGTGGITSIWNVRAACSNNLFLANGVLNIPNLSGGCTCNYQPISQVLVPSGVFE